MASPHRIPATRIRTNDGFAVLTILSVHSFPIDLQPPWRKHGPLLLVQLRGDLVSPKARSGNGHYRERLKPRWRYHADPG